MTSPKGSYKERLKYNIFVPEFNTIYFLAWLKPKSDNTIDSNKPEEIELLEKGNSIHKKYTLMQS